MCTKDNLYRVIRDLLKTLQVLTYMILNKPPSQKKCWSIYKFNSDMNSSRILHKGERLLLIL